jgi:hypothetical protein
MGPDYTSDAYALDTIRYYLNRVWCVSRKMHMVQEYMDCCINLELATSRVSEFRATSRCENDEPLAYL